MIVYAKRPVRAWPFFAEEAALKFFFSLGSSDFIVLWQPGRFFSVRPLVSAGGGPGEGQRGVERGIRCRERAEGDRGEQRKAEGAERGRGGMGQRGAEKGRERQRRAERGRGGREG